MFGRQLFPWHVCLSIFARLLSSSCFDPWELLCSSTETSGIKRISYDVNLSLKRHDIISESDAKIFIAPTNVSLRASGMWSGTVSWASPRSCPLEWISLYATHRLLQIFIMISVSLRVCCVRYFFGRTHIKRQIAARAICLYYFDVSRISTVVLHTNKIMYFFVRTSRTNMFPLFYWPHFVLLSRK